MATKSEYVKKLERLARAESEKLDKMGVETVDHEKTIRSLRDQEKWVREDEARATESLRQQITDLQNQLKAIEEKFSDKASVFGDQAYDLQNALVSMKYQKRLVVRMSELLQVLQSQAAGWRILEAGKFTLGGCERNNFLGRWHIEDIEARHNGIYVKTTIGKDYRKVLDLNDLYDIKMVREEDLVYEKVTDYSAKTDEGNTSQVAKGLKENARTKSVHFTYEV